MKITKKILISSLVITPLTTLAFIPSIVSPKEVETHNFFSIDNCLSKENIENYTNILKKLAEEFDLLENDYGNLLEIFPSKIIEIKDKLIKKIKLTHLYIKQNKDSYKRSYKSYLNGFKKDDSFNINEYMCSRKIKEYVIDPVYKTRLKAEYHDKLLSPTWKWLTEDDFKEVPIVDFGAHNRFMGDSDSIINKKSDEDKIKMIIKENNNNMLVKLEKYKLKIKLQNYYLGLLKNKLELLEKLEKDLKKMMNDKLF